VDSGEPTPEAPRTIFDLWATVQELAFRLQARGEFEYIGTKPLGTGCSPDPDQQCTGTPVKEFRAALHGTGGKPPSQSVHFCGGLLDGIAHNFSCTLHL
jgi:hypothetical protein